MLSEKNKLNHSSLIGFDKNKAILLKQGEQESLAVSYPTRLPIAIASANGPYIYDENKRQYLDFLTGAGVLPLGHGHPLLKSVAKAQIDELVHALDFSTPAKRKFIDEHLSMLPESIRDQYKVQICAPTGADAVEAAVKLCKVHTGGSEIISFQGAYHGCTQGTLSLSSDRSMKIDIANIVEGSHFLPYSACHDCPLDLERASCKVNCAYFFEKSMSDTHSGYKKIAAVIMELVQGEGGVIPAEKEFVTRIAAQLKTEKIPLIIDEIQTGCGRTGTWYAFEQYGIAPDIIVASKALSGIGAPVAMIFYKKELEAFTPGKHIGTFRGNQIAFAAGAEFVRLAKQTDILSNVNEMGIQLKLGLQEISANNTVIGDVRGLGLMLGMEIVEPHSKESSPILANYLQRKALELGLILEVGGRHNAVIRILPPLNISQKNVALAIEILDEAVARTVKQAEHLYGKEADVVTKVSKGAYKR